eukprot:Nitzschia sp. Nitz4//scaffold192_size41448//2057//3710//NITZ4_007480-RA/size41448-snap-gene-0.52-mRNA-1//-1//CDS//3329540221//7246//frame0
MVLPSRRKTDRRSRSGFGTLEWLLFILASLTCLVALTLYSLPLRLDNSNENKPFPNLPKKPEAVPNVVVPKVKKVEAEDEAPVTYPLPQYPPLEKGKTNYHTIFSTGCSTFQDWQSYVLFYHLLSSGQEGPVTRIASGCNAEDARVLLDVFEKEIKPMAPDKFFLHLTPEFSKVIPGRNFKYFNKPYGTRHWFQEALGYPDNHAEHDDTIVALLDPDQILVRPFTNDFTNSSEKWKLEEGYKLKVEHGSPFSQQYGYGLQWKRKVNASNVFHGDSPVITMEDSEAWDYYVGMGPPYVGTSKDMYNIVSKWAEIVPNVHADYPFLLAEMFAYNLAAAHLGMRHTIAHSFMVSDVFAGGEGWKLVDAVPAEDICYKFPESEYPHVIHYCQRYFVGKWFIGKYKLRKDFLSCGAPLLTLPPADVAWKYEAALTPDGKYRELTKKNAKREAFMLCLMIQKLNEAAIYYKKNHCDENANYDYSYTFHDNMTMPDGP